MLLFKVKKGYGERNKPKVKIQTYVKFSDSCKKIACAVASKFCIFAPMSIRENLQYINQKIQQACWANGRPADSVKLIAVSKTKSAEQIWKPIKLGNGSLVKTMFRSSCKNSRIRYYATLKYSGT
jgi:hypothetical protein